MRPLYPPGYFLASIALQLTLHRLLPVARVLAFPWTLSGLVPIGFGAYLNIAADRAFKVSRTTVKPFQRARVLLTEGIFRLTRNPMYLGMVLALVGVAIALGTLSPFFVCPPFAVLLHFRFILSEERLLAETFGSNWNAYSKKTRRWV